MADLLAPNVIAQGDPEANRRAALAIAEVLARPAKGVAALTGMADPSVAPWLQPSIIPEKYNHPYGTPQPEIERTWDARIGEDLLGGVGNIAKVGPKIAQALRAAPDAEGQFPLPLKGGGMREILAYHGSTERGLKKISSKRAVETEGATFHATNPDVAETFTFPRAYGEAQYYSESGRPLARGRVYETKLTPNRVFEVPDQLAQKFIDDSAFQSRVMKEAAASGYDAVRARNVLEGIGERYKGDVYGVTRDSIIDILRKYALLPAGVAGVGALGAVATPDQAQAAPVDARGIAKALREGR